MNVLLFIKVIDFDELFFEYNNFFPDFLSILIIFADFS